jgi:ParB family transcriptional regulator, chromosome partitioning protein
MKTTAKQASQTIGNLINIELIQLPLRGQPRRYFNSEKLEQLTESVKVYGILEPLIIRTTENDTYELVAGERRLRAARAAGLDKVPVIIRQFTDSEAFEIALLENLQRDDLNPIDETEGILDLLEKTLQCSKQEIISLLNQAANAKRRNQDLKEEVVNQLNIIDHLFLKIGRLNRESFRTNRLPLLNLPTDVLQVLREGQLTYTKAKAMVSLEEEERQKLIEIAISEDLSLREIKLKVQEISGVQGKKRRINVVPEYINQSGNIQENLSKSLVLSTPISKKLFELANASSNLELSVWSDKEKQESIENLLSQIQEILES